MPFVPPRGVGEVREIGGGFSPVYVDRIPEQCRTGDRAWVGPDDWVGPDE